MSPGSHCHTHKQVRNALSLYSGNQTDKMLMVMVIMVMVVVMMVVMVMMMMMMMMMMTISPETSSKKRDVEIGREFADSELHLLPFVDVRSERHV